MTALRVPLSDVSLYSVEQIVASRKFRAALDELRYTLDCDALRPEVEKAVGQLRALVRESELLAQRLENVAQRLPVDYPEDY